DGDEITLGLDPNSGSTNGTPDSERTFVQTVGADSEVLAAINDNENVPFEVSLEMKAAGVAEKNLSAYESVYSAVMQNDAVIGTIPQFSYTSGLNVEEVKVKFELDNSITSNTLGTFADGNNEFTGIKRLNIFKYFEDINMLLPVETFHDINNNVVYTVTDCLGTYCLMDMEIWLDSLGISSISEKAEVEESEAMSQNSIDNGNYIRCNVSELNARSNNDEIKDNINVVFIIDTRENQKQLENVKKEILDVSRTVLKNSPNGRIYIFEQNTEVMAAERYKVYSAKGNRFFTDYNDLSEVLSGINAKGSSEKEAILSDALDGVLSVCDLSRETYVFSLFNQENVIYRENNGYSLLDAAVERNVDISVIAEIDNSKKYGYAHDMYKKSSGIFVADTGSDYSATVLNHIYGKKVNEEEENTGEYNMILATGLRNVQLKAPITEEYALLALEDEIDETQPDTDEDGLPDYKEINFGIKGADDKPLIEFINGIVDLPTYGECVDIKSELTYVEHGLYRFDNQLVTNADFISYVKHTVRVLPIVSDPTSEDGDEDGLLDADVTKHYSSIIAPQDPNPLRKDGPDGLWVEHIRNAKRDDIPHKLGDWYGYYHIDASNKIEREVNKKLANLFGYILINGFKGLKCGFEEDIEMRSEFEYLISLLSGNDSIADDETMLYYLDQIDFDNGFDINNENSGYEGFYYFMCELLYLKKEGKIDFNKKDVENMIILLKGCVESVEEYGNDIIHEEVMKILNVLKSWVNVESEDEKNRILASFGSRLCNFKADEFGTAVHSQFYSWEYVGGYNNLYDSFLYTFSGHNMGREKFDFEFSGIDKEYILWIWRGDYLGLGAGAEIGIYSRDKGQSSSNDNLDHYRSDYNLKKPMKLYLYEYNSSTDIDNIFSWDPTDEQWWITGFNPEYVDKVDVKKQVMVGCVDFTGNEDMFNGLYTKYEKEYKYKNKSKYLIFDKINYNIWVCWFGEDLI
ncbi:MAG: DUF4474 domain-containing protein, partial [Ruminococcus flavefaciens]|nr:DUF4474 domain-containing protein [Ruminococcus flavefaciens]